MGLFDKQEKEPTKICPHCNVPLMPGMTICPRCRYDITKPDGGEGHKTRLEDIENQKLEEKCKQAIQEQFEQDRREKNIHRFTGEALGLRDVVYHINGARGRSIDIYPYKCVIGTGVTVGSLINGNSTDGEKTIYYQDCIGLQVKYPGITLGYLQFETASMTMNNSSSNFFNENSFTFEEHQISQGEMKIIVGYIKSQLDKIKEAQRNMWFNAAK